MNGLCLILCIQGRKNYWSQGKSFLVRGGQGSRTPVPPLEPPEQSLLMESLYTQLLLYLGQPPGVAEGLVFQVRHFHAQLTQLHLEPLIFGFQAL